MERLGNYLRQNLPKLQRLVEEELCVKLGEIKIAPITRFVDDFIYHHASKIEDKSGGSKSVIRILGYMLVFLTEDAYFLTSGGIAKAGDSTIYYTRSPLVVLGLTNAKMMATGLHELTHIAHAQLGNFSPITTEPTKYTEAFAEYITARIMKKQGELMPRSYCQEECDQFESELRKRSITTLEQVVQFVLEQKQETD